jgi:hypothetical protein
MTDAILGAIDHDCDQYIYVDLGLCRHLPTNWLSLLLYCKVILDSKGKCWMWENFEVPSLGAS